MIQQYPYEGSSHVTTAQKRTRNAGQRTIVKSDSKNQDFAENEVGSDEDSDQETEKKKDKKLVFLGRSVLKCVRQHRNITGTEITEEILELYKQFSGKGEEFKNVQRRVYDAINVLSAMGIINKHKSNVEYNEFNQFIDDTVQPSTAPDN